MTGSLLSNLTSKPQELAKWFRDDEILLRADDAYEPDNAFSRKGSNSDSKKTGTELVEAFHNGFKWWVGRKGNIQGTLFTEAISELLPSLVLL